MIPLLEELRRARERVIDRRSSGWSQRLERISRSGRRHGPGGGKPWPMVECRDQRLVFAEQQITNEPIHRISGIDDRLPAHAVAGVEEHAQADRHTGVCELRDDLAITVLEDLKVVLREPG